MLAIKTHQILLMPVVSVLVVTEYKPEILPISSNTLDTTGILFTYPIKYCN